MTRYYAAVCAGLSAQGVEVRVPMVTTSCDFETNFTRSTRWIRRIPRVAAMMDAVSRLWFHRLIRRGAYDFVLVTSPEFDAGFLKANPQCKFVMVVHDLMSCVTAPDGLYDAAGPGLAALLYLARRASLIICISQDTRDALLRQGVVAPEAVRVVRTGNLLAAMNPSAANVDLPERFLLFVGERSGRKGFFNLVRALQTVMQEDRDLHLICTGTLREAEWDYLRCHGIAERVQAMQADDGVLVALYRCALCLIYPSLYEGFGLPVIEAMHYGCPVITTEYGALKEIAGDAVVYVDPNSTDSIAKAIREVINQPGTRQELRNRGLSHSRDFDSEKMMRDFYLALRPILDQ